MSAREDYELADAAQNARDQQDLDPLLPPEYKNITSADEYATSPSAHGLRLGGEADSAASRAASRRSVFTSLALTTSTLLVVILAAPLFMLWRNGIFDDGAWRQALGAHRPAPDHGSFPTDIGYAGPSSTGKEPALVLTAPHLPLQTAQPVIFANPSDKKMSDKDKHFNILQSWGQLSPWYSVESHGLKKAESVEPEGCRIVGLHWLQRHGARYPTSDLEGPGAVAKRLREAKGWKAHGALSFLNEWNYKLGTEVLTPFGRQQLFNLGVSARVKYGFLLDKFKDRLPVFRTESQDRMLKSAQNFASGFFGIPVEDQFNLEVMIEWPGFNCTLAPYMHCSNDNAALARSVKDRLTVWENHYLQDAQKRLNKLIDGYEFTILDAKDFMEMCPYETVALGYSSFCDLFTVEEWKAFQYRFDIMWWYGSGFGSPVARASGIGYVQELVSRLTHTRITEHNSTTNSSFHNDLQFPLNDALYVDFTHDTTFAQLLPALNLTSFAASGSPPLDHIPKHRSFISSKFCPFATNMQFQVLACGDSVDDEPTHIRLILNDGVVPLTGLRGCPDDEDGKCPLNTFVAALKDIIGEVDFAQECLIQDLDYSLETVNGSPVRV
ncbi:hypothetical protein NliqN6_4334 [Naganishia liquefaciens]|uniref:Uncharacterized protein n=1 Tax=Naganishia liquefaciens TaxID=104408 RepID=A0A8H3TVK1_9TREE|nr:hypothetical protein NliqN6_4334 [Naganishia liquefaciens]